MTSPKSSDNSGQLDLVFDLARILLTERELNPLLDRFLVTLLPAVQGADAGAVFLFDSERNGLVAVAANGFDLSVLEQIRIESGKGLVGCVYQSRRSMLCATPAEIEEVQKSLPLAYQEAFESARGKKGSTSAIAVPLALGDTTLGVLLLESRVERHPLSCDDLSLIARLAGLAALAVNTIIMHSGRHTALGTELTKSELISILAHEMRTPLTSIKGYSTALLMEEASFSPETQREFLKYIDQECDTLQHLIHDLLESSDLEAGALKLEREPVELGLLAENVARDMSFRSYGHRFVIEYPKDLPVVLADPDRIVQVFRNLLDNAVKYSPEGKVVTIRGEVQNNEIVFSVSDEGIGIPPEHLNRLFEKFFRVRSGPGRHISGSGLGLPVARTIVESHGGRIWAESKVGEGSTFYFTLPFQASKVQAGS